MTRQRKLEALEGEYIELLLAALKRCAAGRFGLFGQNDATIATLNKHMQKRLTSSDASELLDLGDQITMLRSRLGYSEPFAPHTRLMEARSSHHANTLGEPKLAKILLKDMTGLC